MMKRSPAHGPASALVLALGLAALSVPPLAAQAAGSEIFEPVNRGLATRIAVSPDGNLAAISCDDELALWRTSDARILASRRFDRKVSALGWAADGSLAVLLPRSPCYLLDPATLETRRIARTGQLGETAAVAPGGRFALASGNGSQMESHSWVLVDLEAGTSVEFSGPSGIPYALSPDGTLALILTKERAVQALEVPGGAARPLPFDLSPVGDPYYATPGRVVWSPDGSVLAMEFALASESRTLLYEVDSGEFLGMAKTERLDPFFFGFAGADAFGSLLAAFRYGGALRVVPVSALADPDFPLDSVPGPEMPENGVAYVAEVAYSGGTAVIGNQKGGVAFIRSGASRPLLAGPWMTETPYFAGSAGIWAAAYGDWIATGAIPEAGGLPTHPADIVRNLSRHPGARSSVALPVGFRLDRLRFGAAGTVLLASSRDEVLAFDAAGLEPLGRATGFGEWPLEVDASADGRFILVSPEDGPSRVYRSADGELVTRLPFESAWVEGSRGFFSADGSVAILEPGASSIVFYEASSGRRTGLLALGDALAPGAALVSDRRNWAAVPLGTGEYALIDLAERKVSRAAWPEWPVLAFWEEAGRPVFGGYDADRTVSAVDARNGETLFSVRPGFAFATILPVGEDFRLYCVYPEGRAILPPARAGKEEW
ncbi:MAG: hypothetical protein JXA15_00470 [Spirochaetales bacterium]|nr:hypothetical protein [Spirochaetales bacterium]